MDQRQAGQSRTPLIPFSYDTCNDDQLAVMDELGIERFNVMGGCIGCAHIWNLVERAPGRVTAAVCQDPVGLDDSNSIEVFYRMFAPAFDLAESQGIEAVIQSAQEKPLFVMNNAAGPFAATLAADAAARDELRAMGAQRYVALLNEFQDGMWPVNPPYFTVSEAWMRSCPVPVLLLPGRDEFHPAGVSKKICAEAPRAHCLAPDCRDGDNLQATIETIRKFLGEESEKAGL
jgi:pimeloyl-ACP methyl ester carboxylesterase